MCIAFAEAGLRTIDEDAVVHLERLNPSLGDYVRKVRSLPSDGGTYFYFPKKDSRHEYYTEFNATFHRMVKVFNLSAKSTSLKVAVRLNFGRFGNVFGILRETISFCRHHGLPLWCDWVDKRYAGYYDFHESDIKAVDLSDVQVPRNEALLVIEGGFIFLGGLFRQTPHNIETLATLHKAFKIKPEIPYPIGKVVIHLRGGDIMANPPSHSFYVQPPVAWYVACLKAHRRHHSDLSVMIVHEDGTNPCLRPLVEWCQDEGIPVVTQSGTLDEDYAHIMRARVLLDSNGTFTDGARFVSDYLHMVYHFDFNLNADRYIAMGKWVGSPEQRALMVNIPEEDLKMPDDPYQAAFRRHFFVQNWTYGPDSFETSTGR